jgi:hypothetical protein
VYLVRIIAVLIAREAASTTDTWGMHGAAQGRDGHAVTISQPNSHRLPSEHIVMNSLLSKLSIADEYQSTGISPDLRSEAKIGL